MRRSNETISGMKASLLQRKDLEPATCALLETAELVACCGFPAGRGRCLLVGLGRRTWAEMGVHVIFGTRTEVYIIYLTCRHFGCLQSQQDNLTLCSRYAGVKLEKDTRGCEVLRTFEFGRHVRLFRCKLQQVRVQSNSSIKATKLLSSLHF